MRPGKPPAGGLFVWPDAGNAEGSFERRGSRGSTRSVGVWSHRDIDGIDWTTLRHGQLFIPLEGTNTAVQVGALAERPAFCDAAVQAIQKGDLDEPITALRRARSAALKDEAGAGRKAA